MDILRWIERTLFRPGAAPADDAEQRTCLLPLLNCSGVHMVVEIPPGRRAWAVAYSRELALFHEGLLAAQRGERRN